MPLDSIHSWTHRCIHTARVFTCAQGSKQVPVALQAVLDDGRKKELQSVIQAHFKDWLVSSGNMRQVYDLARMERGDATPSAHSQPPF